MLRLFLTYEVYMNNASNKDLSCKCIEDLVTFFELLDRIKVSQESMRED